MVSANRMGDFQKCRTFAEISWPIMVTALDFVRETALLMSWKSRSWIDAPPGT